MPSDAELTHAVERLRESEERYRALTAAIPHMIWTLNADLTLDSLNEPASRFTGLSVDQVNRMGWNQLLHPDDRGPMLAAAAGPLARGEPHELQYRFRHHSGEYRWVESRAVPISSSDGTRRWVGSTVDIHELKTAESRLLDSESRFRFLLDSVPQLVWTCLEDGRCDFLSRQWVAYTGIPESEQLGYGWSETVHPDDRAALLAAWQDAVARRGSFDVEFRIRHHAGDYRWFKTRAEFYTQPDGQSKWFGTNTDIHDLKVHDEQLQRQEEERFRSAFDHAPIGMALVAPDGSWLRVNEALCTLVGYSADELLRTNFQAITHPDDLEADISQVRDMLAGTIATYQMEKRYFHKHGHEVDVLLSVSLVRDADRRPLYFISQIKDMTDRMRSERQLRASLLEKEVLLKEIHHRVKNNLQVISSLLDLQAGSADAHSAELLNESRSRVKSMALIHERLYRSTDLSGVDFSGYLTQLADDLYHAYRVSKDEVALNTTIVVPPLPIDIAIPCGLILNELISNSLKHAFPEPRSGTLSVAMRTVDDSAIALTVSDDGIGFPDGLATADAKSFGLTLVSTLAGQLGGMVVHSSVSGAETTVTFPYPGASR